MLKNSVYDLLLQLTEENKSLWRIKNEYLRDCESDNEMVSFWKKLEADKESHVKELSALTKKYL